MIGLLVSLLGLWVLLGAVWMAVWPLIGSGGGAPADAEVELAELEVEKARLLGEIHELELDYETGKLSDEDHREIESRLKGRAVEVMRAIDALRNPTGPGRPPADRARARPEPAVPDRPTAGRTSG